MPLRGINLRWRIRLQTRNERVLIYAGVDENARREEKYRFLDDAGSVGGIEWQELDPDAKNNWLTVERQDEFETLMPVGNKETKSSAENETAIFQNYSRGVETTRDDWEHL